MQFIHRLLVCVFTLLSILTCGPYSHAMLDPEWIDSWGKVVTGPELRIGENSWSYVGGDEYELGGYGLWYGSFGCSSSPAEVGSWVRCMHPVHLHSSLRGSTWSIAMAQFRLSPSVVGNRTATMSFNSAMQGVHEGAFLGFSWPFDLNFSVEPDQGEIATELCVRSYINNTQSALPDLTDYNTYRNFFYPSVPYPDNLIGSVERTSEAREALWHWLDYTPIPFNNKVLTGISPGAYVTIMVAIETRIAAGTGASNMWIINHYWNPPGWAAVLPPIKIVLS